ncbi:hypothetical protein PMG11_00494 [Penicillium brasilianum]|uniref:Zn(2)-C6 fungal-type domain-containing protein n=1 Tax=Penicillium brasilianum TaxID=104259 RepID=A0A0F7TGQ2_PENBI|nr:hypothetical protein PMG11_00494 [Penicillium brasilianum]
MVKTTKGKPSRITTACNTCRSRKQKCSGGKPVCQQCLEYNRPCNWPEQLRRGPPKGHIEAVEHRLQVTENALLRLLSQVSNAQLLEAFPKDSPFERTDPCGYVPLSRIERKGIEDWAQFPLDKADNIRKWQKFCVDQGATSPPHQVVGNIHSPSRSSCPSGQNRKNSALQGSSNRPFEERVEFSGASISLQGPQSWSTSPTALQRAQERPTGPQQARKDPNANASEDYEVDTADSGPYPLIGEDRAITVSTSSSWNGAPSLNFQQRFLW